MIRCFRLDDGSIMLVPTDDRVPLVRGDALSFEQGATPRVVVARLRRQADGLEVAAADMEARAEARRRGEGA